MWYNFLKNIAELNLWLFEYSRADYQNLVDDMEYNKIHLFVDPIATDSSFSDSGFEQETYIGKMMLLVSSDVDETYKEKYENNIQPLMNNALATIKQTLICSDYEVVKFSTVEVINLFDTNLDGVLITYAVKQIV
jgi:hypothetical protein